MQPRILATLPLAFLLSSLPLVGQQVATLTPSKDNTLYFDLAGTTSNGSGPHLFVGNSAGGTPFRALLAFDVASAIPAGSRILDVQVAVRISRTRAFSPMNVGLHRVLADWGEGASVAPGQGGGGAPAQPGDATWLHRMFPNVLWTSPGGDYAATASAVTAMPATVGATATWSSTAALVADVQSWLDRPQGNFGWLLRSPEQSFATARRLDSRESTLASARPQLVVRYDMPPPASVTVVGTGCATATGRSLALAAPSLPTLGNAMFGLVLSQGPPGQPAVHLLSFGTTSTGVPVYPGCSFHLAPLAGFPGIGPFALDAAGGATTAIPIPPFPALGGTNLGAQSLALEPAIGPGFVLSNALQIQLGR